MDREKERYDRETPEQDKRLDMAEVLSKPAGGGPGKDQDPMKETMEALKTAIGLSDLEGNLFHVNPAFLDLCGCRKKEILGRSVIEIWNNRDDGLRFLEVLREKGAHVGEETARRKGGPPFRILISAERFQDGEGDLKGMVFSFVDIEERIRNAKITAVIHEMSRAVNSTRDLKEMFGLIHRSLSRILDTRNFFIALYDRATDTISFPYFQDERDTEFSIVGAKGSGSLTAEVILAGKPRLFTETQLAERMAAPPSKRPPGKPAKVWLAVPIAVKGEVIGAVGVQSYDDPDLYTERDVSLLESVSDQVAIAIERKRTEDALRESERKYRSILESIQDGYYELDLKGRFVFFNRALTRIFGASREELWGVNIRSFADDENIQFCTRIFNKVYTTGNPVNDFEWTLVRKNGEERQVATSISLIRDSQGKVTGFQGIIRDVTDQRRLEAALQQTQKMEAIGTLAGGIAHNFNNLLMGIQGNISLMLLDADKNHPFYPRLTTMEKLVQNGSKLTSQLLGYAREGRYQLLPLDINEVVTQISETFGMTRKDIHGFTGIWPAIFRKSWPIGASSSRSCSIFSSTRRMRCREGGISSWSRETLPTRTWKHGPTSPNPGNERRGSLPGHAKRYPPGHGSTGLQAQTRGIREGFHEGYRRGYGPEDSGADFRSFLHHQGTQQGNGVGPCFSIRDRKGPRRLYRCLIQGG
ncbi:MAG: PAS domain S-box protein [Deltaproteobacteria bacterium]|nr:PAS domain S-box protein [Deltaproteobacteria bacterium]